MVILSTAVKVLYNRLFKIFNLVILHFIDNKPKRFCTLTIVGLAFISFGSEILLESYFDQPGKFINFSIIDIFVIEFLQSSAKQSVQNTTKAAWYIRLPPLLAASYSWLSFCLSFSCLFACSVCLLCLCWLCEFLDSFFVF